MEQDLTSRTGDKRRTVRRAGLALLWFFAAMLALTYLSRAVSDALKARVEIGYPGSSVLDESVEGTGTWAAGETQFYATYYTRRIVQVFRGPGETVAVGDPLFAYDVSTVKGGKKVSDKTVQAAKKAVDRAERAIDGAEDPAYAESVLENARQALAYAEFTYAQTYALQNGGVVRASFAGTVVKCDLAVGKSSTSGGTGFEIAPAGVAFSMTVSPKEAERIGVGDSVTLYAEGLAEPKTLLVDAVKPPDAKGEVRILCSGDGGKQRLVNTKQDWKIEKQSARYRQTIPVSALRQGGGEDYYVLLLGEMETILGTQLVAKKETVKLLAHDSRLAAVEGALSERDRLITSSTKELKDGDYVVLRDGD